MPSPNESAANLDVNFVAKEDAKLIYNQITNSVLSKKGMTTLTGIFEGTPQNVVVAKRGFTTPGTGTSVTTIDEVAGTNAKTYLESLKNKKR